MNGITDVHSFIYIGLFPPYNVHIGISIRTSNEK